jgi:hypothetical protein
VRQRRQRNPASATGLLRPQGRGARLRQRADQSQQGHDAAHAQRLLLPAQRVRDPQEDAGGAQHGHEHAAAIHAAPRDSGGSKRCTAAMSKAGAMAPWLHLIRFHGVLAPNAKLRTLVVPQEPEQPAQESRPAECEANCAHYRSVQLSWAELLKRVFEIDMEHCPNCGGELKIIAAILDQPVIEKIFTHLRLQARAPPRMPGREPHLQAAWPSRPITWSGDPAPRAARRGCAQASQG